MKQYEASARTVEEAIEQGLQELGVSIGDVDVRVVEEGSKGLFGLFGSRPARVCLTVKASEEDPLGNLLEEETVKAEKPAKKAEKKPENKSENKPEKKAEKKPAEKKPEKKPAEKKPEPEKKAEKAEAAEEAEKPEPRTLEKPEVTMIPADQLDPESPAGVAKEFLGELTKLMGVDVTIDMGTDAEGNVYGYMNGDTLGILIGRRGETLDALQYLTSLKVNRGREGYTRVTLDTENYRAKREDTLIRLANRMANRALRTGRKVSLEPMNPYERRIIHFALQQNEGVTTHSEGDEPNRHVVITHKK
ncbi:MAG: protein jag [Clostridiales bacterium]|nr:protein jag [Clostridiales bacterium]